MCILLKHSPKNYFMELIYVVLESIVQNYVLRNKKDINIKGYVNIPNYLDKKLNYLFYDNKLIYG